MSVYFAIADFIWVFGRVLGVGINFCPMPKICASVVCKKNELRFVIDLGSLLFGKNGYMHLVESGS